MGIVESPSTSDDDQALNKLSETVKFGKGRYMVTLSWKDEKPSLPQNYQLAVGRLKFTLRKLEKSPLLQSHYDEIIGDQLERGIIKKVTSDSFEGPINHYFLHHPVVNWKTLCKLLCAFEVKISNKLLARYKLLDPS